MLEQNNVVPNSIVTLFTADGGPGQLRWYNVRLFAELVGSSGGASVTLKVNGLDVPNVAGYLSVNVAPGTEKRSTSDHLLLVTDDVVSFETQGSANLNVKFSTNVDTEEL